jgi:hypothetical protein
LVMYRPGRAAIADFTSSTADGSSQVHLMNVMTIQV